MFGRREAKPRYHAVFPEEMAVTERKKADRRDVQVRHPKGREYVGGLPVGEAKGLS